MTRSGPPLTRGRAVKCGPGDFSLRAPDALDGETRQLLAHGTEVHVSPKAFELLTFLLANRRRAVSKTELQEFLWPLTLSMRRTCRASLRRFGARWARPPASRHSSRRSIGSAIASWERSLKTSRPRRPLRRAGGRVSFSKIA